MIICMQELASPAGAVIASGSSAAIGAFDLVAHVRGGSEQQNNASVGCLSMPYADLHKMHDLAGQAITSVYQQYYSQHGQAPQFLSMGYLQQPHANMVMLQVRILPTPSSAKHQLLMLNPA